MTQNFVYRWLQKIISIFLLFHLLAFKAQPVKPIVLRNEQLPFTPREFYIDKVIDERSRNSSAARLLTDDGKESYRADLQGGTINAINEFVRKNLHQNTLLRPIIVRVREFEVNELLMNGRIEGKTTINMSFYFKRGDEMVHLIDYRGGGKYWRPTGKQIDVVEPSLRSGIKNALVYLNNWVDKEAATNINLAKSVKVFFTNYKDALQGDTVYYSVNRPLNWDDFRAKPIMNTKFAAEVWPMFGYDEQTEVVNSVVNVRLTMKVYLPKADCWVRDGYRTDYTLNHEQRHFDVVKIVAERFKQKIIAEKLLPGNYDGPINVEYLEALREIYRLQKAYDGETTHGASTWVQENWNRRIDEDLRKLGVIKNNS